MPHLHPNNSDSTPAGWNPLRLGHPTPATTWLMGPSIWCAWSRRAPGAQCQGPASRMAPGLGCP
eukprot:11520599-Alexandrium_andersonii.AAC.1